METCDVLIVGGGPAGSSCAWGLRESGLDVTILDKRIFPRDKVCGGWITPGVLADLAIDAGHYGRTRMLQPITSFRVGSIGHGFEYVDYGRPVSYGIRRREFDDYLLRRSGAVVIQGTSLSSMERTSDGWVVNGELSASVVVGAGGHFCPVAQQMGAVVNQETAVVAQEVEFEMNRDQQVATCVEATTPEMYFCPDMRGYGWCVRKGNILNIGLGRMDPHSLSHHVAEFLGFLRKSERISFDVPPLRGHAYLLYPASKRDIAGEGYMLIGDSAGLASAQSGEGIRPAVESGLLAAKAILASGRHLSGYRSLIRQRFGAPSLDWMSMAAGSLPPRLMTSIASSLLHWQWFVRSVVLDRWFLQGVNRAA